jgi:spermidine synthase
MLYLCIFLSGAAALIYEIALSRMLIHVFGNGVQATSTILCAYMIGLAAGAYLGGKYISRSLNSLRVYAIVELGIALLGLVVPVLFGTQVIYGLSAILPAMDQVGGVLARLLWSAIFVLPLATLIGATYPILVNAAGGKQSASGLYAVNTAGAMIGTVCGAFVLIPNFGLSASCFVAAGVNCFIAILVLSGQDARAPNASQARRYSRDVDSDSLGAQASCLPIGIVVAAVCGFVAMWLEVVWTRLFSLVLGGTTYAFATVLAILLLGTACGAATAARIKARPFIVLFALGGTILASLWLIAELPLVFASVAEQLNQLAIHRFSVAIAARAILISAVVFPISFLSGMMFPIALRLSSISDENPEQAAGTVYGANSLGAVCGALVAGFAGIPLLSRICLSGIQASTFVCGLISLLLAIYVAASLSKRKAILTACSVIAAAAFFLLFAPKWQPALMTSGLALYDWQTLAGSDRHTLLRDVGAEPGSINAPTTLFYREGLNSTVSVTQNPKTNVTFLRTDGKVEGAIPSDMSQPAPASDLTTQKLLAALPIALHSSTPHRVLVIGYGTGTTSGTALSSPAINQLTIAELERSVLEADTWFKHANGDPLRREWTSTGRTKPRAIDGRNLLAAEKGKFDVIISQPAEPWVAGSADLYTLEFWRLAKSKLAPDGIFCQWVQLYSVTPEYLAVLTRTFAEVFPDRHAFLPKGAGELILIGGSHIRDPNAAAINRQEIQQHFGPQELQRFEARMRDVYHRIPVNTDDNLLTEYKLAPQLYEFGDTIDENVRALNP